MTLKRDQPERGPEPLRDILGALFTARGWGRRQERLHLERAWEAVAGESYAAATQVGSLKRGVFEVYVESAVLMQELNSFHKRRLLAELKKKLPNQTISDLKFRAGRLS